MNPPDKAIVLCLDEKSQIQALDRTQPSLPMKKGRAGTMTHDYKRNGTTTLFAALDVLSGKVIGQCLPQHTNNELMHFLKKVDREVPKGLAVHVITDNYGTRGQENVQAWLAKHPRFHFHFTPTSSSWLNLVERWFRELTQKAIRRLGPICGRFLSPFQRGPTLDTSCRGRLGRCCRPPVVKWARLTPIAGATRSVRINY